MANLNSINYPRILAKLIDYDANGNQKEITRRISDPEQPLGHREETLRKNLWDSEDRLRAVDLNPVADTDKPLVAAYTYDAAGERTVKYVPGRFDARYSAKETGNEERLEAMLYPSPLLTVKTLPIPEGVSRGELERIALTKYTNHYYIGSERIASALGTLKQLGILCEQTGDPGQALINLMDQKVGVAGNALQQDYGQLDKTLVLPPFFHYNGERLNCDLTSFPELYSAYWYHPDHLGSSSYITNLDGEITQHMEYLPFGETLVEEHWNSNNSPYKFNAKEYDAETGNYYYGARYYDPKVSIWLSVDPLAHVMPAWSPYSFVFNNPLSYIDPDGRIPYPITIRAFAPFKSFGLGFHGDNRGYSTGNVSARVHQKINFDTDKTSITTNAWSSPSWHAVNPNYKKTATPSVNFEGDFTIQKSGNAKTFNFGTHVAGGNPLTPGAPPIDVFSNFSITENKKAGTLDISGKLTGDNFPSTEAFITDPNGNNVFIGIGFYEGSPFSSLWGENKDNPITDFNFSITTDSDGNFTGINAAGKNYSISDWNKMFETADPHKNANKKSEQTPGERWGRPFE